MIQVYCSRTGSLGSTSSDRYNSIINQRTWKSTEADATMPWTAPGVFRNFSVKAETAPGGSTAHVFTILKNGVATGVTVTCSDTTQTVDQVNSFSVTQNDKLVIKRAASGGAPATTEFEISIEHVSTNATAQYYGGVSSGPSNSLTQITNILCPLTSFVASTTSTTQAAAPCATGGSINFWTAFLSVQPGGANTRTVYLAKNGVRQDGTGGTPNSAITFTGSSAGPISTAVFATRITYSAGDILTLEAVPTGASGAATNVGFCVSADGEVAGESNFCSNATSSGPSTSATNYNDRAQQGSWNATETAVEGISGVTPFSLGKFRALLPSTIVQGTITLNVRKNEANPTNGPSLVIDTTATTFVDTTGNTVTISSGDRWTIRSVPAGSPTNTPIAWGLAQLISENLPDEGALSGLYFFNSARTNDKYYSNITGLPPTTETEERKIPDPTVTTYLLGDE